MPSKDGLADIRRDEQIDARSEAVPLLKELVQEDDDERRDDELDDQQQADAGPKVRWLVVEPCGHIYGGFAEGDDQSEHCEILVSMCPSHVCIYG